MMARYQRHAYTAWGLKELELQFTDVLHPSKGCLDEQYKIIKRIGKGGNGEVFTAMKLSTNEEVVVKSVDKRFAQDIVVANKSLPIEALALHHLKNVEGVVKLVEYFETESSFLYIMERRVNSMDLFGVIHRFNSCLTETRSKHIIRQLMRTLTAVQQRGLTHGDLKEANVLIDLNTWDAILLDFGTVEAASHSIYLRPVKGTPGFMPPEAVAKGGYRDGDSFTVFSVGVILHQLLFNRKPFPVTGPGSTVTEASQRRLAYRLRQRKTVSDEAKDLVFRCLMLDPKARIKLGDIENHAWFDSDDKENEVPAKICQQHFDAAGEQEEKGKRVAEEDQSPPVKKTKIDVPEGIRNVLFSACHCHSLD